MKQAIHNQQSTNNLYSYQKYQPYPYYKAQQEIFVLNYLQTIGGTVYVVSIATP